MTQSKINSKIYTSKLFKKGFSLIEVLVSLFLIVFLVSGMVGLYNYVNDFDKTKELVVIEEHFNFIINLLTQNCDSFIGDTIKNDIYQNSNMKGDSDSSIPQITVKTTEDPNKNKPEDHRLLYTTYQDLQKNKDLQSMDLLNDNLFIRLKEISLKKATAQFYYHLSFVFESLKTFKEYEKTTRLYLDLNSNNEIISCDLKPKLPCFDINIPVKYVWEEDSSGGKKYYACCHQWSGGRCLGYDRKIEISPSQIDSYIGYISSGAGEPGEALNITDSSTACCLCMIQLHCNEGVWSHSEDCFQRKGRCL